jgi:hypothetical protein
MKLVRIGFIALISGSLFIAKASERVDSSIYAGKRQVTAAEGRPGAVFPSFLEKGKTYHLSFVVSYGEWPPVTMIGRIEKLDADSGWVYINHYTDVKKGKIYEGKFEGYSWININLAYQIFEKQIGT